MKNSPPYLPDPRPLLLFLPAWTVGPSKRETSRHMGARRFLRLKPERIAATAAAILLVTMRRRLQSASQLLPTPTRATLHTRLQPSSRAMSLYPAATAGGTLGTPGRPPQRYPTLDTSGTAMTYLILARRRWLWQHQQTRVLSTGGHCRSPFRPIPGIIGRRTLGGVEGLMVTATTFLAYHRRVAEFLQQPLPSKTGTIHCVGARKRRRPWQGLLPMCLSRLDPMRGTRWRRCPSRRVKGGNISLLWPHLGLCRTRATTTTTLWRQQWEQRL